MEITQLAQIFVKWALTVKLVRKEHNADLCKVGVGSKMVLDKRTQYKPLRSGRGQ